MVSQYYYADPPQPRRTAPRKAAAPKPPPAPEDPAIAAIRQRTVAAAMRCIRILLTRLGRDWNHCGKAACLRARRCCGSACEPDVTERRLLS
jgi:hypothetical protein